MMHRMRPSGRGVATLVQLAKDRWGVMWYHPTTHVQLVDLRTKSRAAARSWVREVLGAHYQVVDGSPDSDAWARVVARLDGTFQPVEDPPARGDEEVAEIFSRQGPAEPMSAA